MKVMKKVWWILILLLLVILGGIILISRDFISLSPGFQCKCVYDPSLNGGLTLQDFTQGGFHFSGRPESCGNDFYCPYNKPCIYGKVSVLSLDQNLYGQCKWVSDDGLVVSTNFGD